MNRTLKFALGMAIAVSAVPGFAQGQFPDVLPDNHWAYTAVQELREAGILVGYPDGLYRGNRPLSRYEFAAALYAAYKRMMGMHGELADRVAELEKMVKGMGGSDTGPITAQIADLRKQVDGMKGWAKRIEDLERGAKEFEAELASMGVDMKKMREDLNGLEERVSKLEKVKPAVTISGDLNFLVLAGHSTDNEFGQTPDGRVLGESKGTPSTVAGLSQDLNVLHEAAFTFKGTNEEGPKWEVTLVQSNLLANGGATGLINYNSVGSGTAFSTGGSSTYVHSATVSFDSALVGQGFGAVIGRMGYQVGPYLFKRTDYTDYYANERWDDGNHRMDGGLLKFNFGAAKLHVFGGVNTGIQTNAGTEVSPIGGGFVDRTLGVQVVFPIGEMGGVNLAYLWHDSNDLAVAPNGNNFNRINVYGGEVNLGFDKFKVYGAYSKTPLSENTSNALDEDNSAFHAGIKYDGGNFTVGGGYREVENFFSAAGSWGRIGNQWNPTNIKGFNAMVSFNAGENLKLYAKGEFAEPKENVVGYAFNGFDKMNTFTVGLDYKLAENWGAMLKYEDTKFDLVGAGADPKQKWYTVGINYGLGGNANIRFTYQFSDLDFGATPAGVALDPVGNGGRYKGGLLGTQLTVRF